MLGDEGVFNEFSAAEAGPMPEAIGAAVARKRTAGLVRRVGAIAGCVALVGVVAAWWAAPAPGPHTLPGPIAGDPAVAEPTTSVRFASVSVLALRMSGMDGSWPVERTWHDSGSMSEPTMYGLRERELMESSPPAS